MWVCLWLWVSKEPRGVRSPWTRQAPDMESSTKALCTLNHKDLNRYYSTENTNSQHVNENMLIKKNIGAMSKMGWRVRYWLCKPGDPNSIFRSQEKVGGENWLYSKVVPTATRTYMCLPLMHTHTHTAQNNHHHHHHNKARCGGLHAPPQHTGGTAVG